MRTLTAAQERIYALQRRQVQVRVFVADATATEVDLSDYLGHNWIRSVEWGEDVDSAGMDATVDLARANHNLSLAPFRTASRPNVSAALLAVGRSMRVEVAVLPAGLEADTSDWVEVFAGVIQTIDSASDSIRLVARGLEDLLQSTFIEDPSEYSNNTTGEPLEDVLQEILDDNLGSGAVTLVVPTTPSWQILLFTSEVHSVWDELDKLVSQIGWCFRYLYNDGASAWELTLYEPERTGAVSVWTFEPSQWFSMNSLATDLSTIRNAVSVTFGDASDLDASGQPTPTTVGAEDSTSTTEYGRRWMGVTLDASSNIDSVGEATRLAEAIVADLAYPKAAVEVEVAFVHHIQLGDVVTVAADRIRIDDDQEMAVVGYRSTIAVNKARTRLQGRFAAPVAKVEGWLARSAQRGVSPIQQVTAPLNPNVINPNLTETIGGIYVNPSMFDGNRKGGFQIEAHSGDVGFTPDLAANSATFIGRAKNAALHLPSGATRLPIGVAQDIVIYYLNDRGVRSASYRLTRTAQRAGLQWIDPEVRLAGSFPGSTFSNVTRGASFPPDGWDMVTGAWGTAAVQDAGGTLIGPLTGAYALTLTTSAATEVVSQLTPCAAYRCYVSQIGLYASDITTGNVVTLTLEWIADDKTTIVATDTIWDAEAAVAGEWLTLRRTHSPPSGGRYARMRAKKTAAAFSFALDRWLFEEDQERDDELSRISLQDEFSGPPGGPIGELAWTLFVENGVVDPGPAEVTKVAASDWKHTGIVSVTVADPASYPIAAYNVCVGDSEAPLAAGLPPLGTTMNWIVRLGVLTTDVIAWMGLWEQEAQKVGPNGEGIADFTQRGIGFLGDGNWYGIVRVVSGGAHVNRVVDLGVTADTTWRRLSWRRVDAGIAFFLDGLQVGSAVSVADFDTPGLFPMFGVTATATDIPSIEVDKMTLHTLSDRT